MKYSRLAALLFCALLASSTGRAQGTPPYKDRSLPVNERVRDLVGRMTLDEKFWQTFMFPGDLDTPANDYSNGVFGLQITPPRGAALPNSSAEQRSAAARADAERVNGIQRYFVEKTRLGIPMLRFEEGVHGLTREGATVFPAAIAMAASWDTALTERVAAAIAREAASRGVRQVLSPVINVVRDVRWGRVEETFGEDPLLSSAMGIAFIAPFERSGIVTTPKHFVANVGDGGRDSYPIEYSPRLLDEVYFPPFKAAILQAHARSVMTAYNSVDGSPATQNRALLNGKLKGEWGFTGFVISDAAATGGATVLHMTEPNTPTASKDAFNAGLDVVFQSSYEQHRPYLDAFRRGLIADSVINNSVARVLRAKFELGLFENPYVSPDSAARLAGSAEHRAIALEASRASIVLLKNDRNVLPLSGAVRSIAVIGADAKEARLGGYTAQGAQGVSILDGIRATTGASGQAIHVTFAAGPGRITRENVVVPAEFLSTDSAGKTVRGVRGEYFDNNRLEGAPRFIRPDARIDFGWTLNSPGRGLPFDWYSVRWIGSVTAPKGGVKRIGVEGNDGYRLWLDEKLIIDNWRKQSFGTRTANVSLAAGTRHLLRLEYFESTGNARVKLVWDVGADAGWQAKIDSAVAVARTSDVAVVVAGLEEGEFRDRAKLSLPGHQEELIQKVAATGKPVVVVLIGGSAVTMSPWLEKVRGVIDAWYPGEEGGRAVADVLFGRYNPAGRLPITFPVFEGQLPLYYNHKPTGRGDDYTDLTGQPLFPFGFGLSYTEFSYSGLVIEQSPAGQGDQAVVRCRVKNTGVRAGDEVVQLYMKDVLGSVARPVMELKRFRRVQLAPGEEKEISFTLSTPDFQMLDRDMRPVVEPGTFRVMIGASSKDIRLRGEIVVR